MFIYHIPIIYIVVWLYPSSIIRQNNNKMKKKEKEKKEMRSHFQNDKMITFRFWKQYMTNKTSIDNFFSFFSLMQCMPHIDGFPWRLSHVKPMFSSLTSTSFHSTNDSCGRTNDTGTNNHVSADKLIARIHHTYLTKELF